MTNSDKKSVSKPKKVSCIAMAFPFIFMIIGSVLFYFGVSGIIDSVGSNYWPTATGKVIVSDVISSGNSYSAYVKYEYKVKDVIYSGNKISYDNYVSVSKSIASKIVNKYHKGTDVTIYYKINDPILSVLEPGAQLQTFFLPLSAFAIFILGLFAFLANKRANQRANEYQTEDDTDSEP